MPTEREQELKHDNKPSFRLRFLDSAERLMYFPYAWLSPGNCIKCFITRIIIFMLAIYGVYKLIT